MNHSDQEIKTFLGTEGSREFNIKLAVLLRSAKTNKKFKAQLSRLG